MYQQISELLKLYLPVNETEEIHRNRTLEFIEHAVSCTSRTVSFGHVTSSAWILSPEHTSILLTHHKILDRWLQLGGHIEENDLSIQDAAVREAREESGIDKIFLLDHKLFDIDVHLIPARNNILEHYHYDFRFILQSTNKMFSVSDESNNLAWVHLSEISSLITDESIIRMANKTAMFLDFQKYNYISPLQLDV